MIHPAIPLTLLALAGPTAAVSRDGRDLDGTEYAQLSIHERIIIRVPRMSITPARPIGRPPIMAPVPSTWKERKGPKCVAVGEIGGAMLGPPGSIDMLMVDGTRLRARLDGDCKPLDYYPGFYIRPAADGMICRDRDAIRMRSGASCDIDDFRTLKSRR